MTEVQKFRFVTVLTLASLSCAAANADEISLTATLAKVVADPGSALAVNLTLDAQSAQKIASLTGERVGAQVFVYGKDVLLTAPIIRAPLDGSHLQITSGADFDHKAALDLADYLNGHGHLILTDTPR